MLRIAALASSVVASIADRLALEQPGLDEPLLHPREDGPVRLQIDQPPRPRNRRMIGRRFVQRQPQKTADRQRVGRPPGDPAFRVDALEVADQQQPEVAARASGSAGP